MQSDPIKCIHVAVPGDPALEKFLYHVALETIRARGLFAENKQQLAAATEEHGELAQALLDHDRGEVPAQAVWEEAIQAAAMAARTGIEGSMEFPKYKMPAEPLPAGTLKASLTKRAREMYERTVKARYLPWDEMSKKRREAWRAFAAVAEENEANGIGSGEGIEALKVAVV